MGANVYYEVFEKLDDKGNLVSAQEAFTGQGFYALMLAMVALFIFCGPKIEA